MGPKIHSSERGQAIILVVLALVALLGFTALAVDGSMIYSDRRYLQSGADAASLGGGAAAADKLEANNLLDSSSGWSTATCAGTVGAAATAAKSAAVKLASDNGFVIASGSGTTPASNKVTVKCGYDPVYASKAGGGKVAIYNQAFMDVTTMITHKTDTAFLHFVYSGAAQNTTTAVTRVRPRQSLAYGYSVVALNPNKCSGNSNGIQFRGNLKFFVDSGGNGGVFSNGCLDVDGGNTPTLTNGGSVYYFYGGNKLNNITFTHGGSLVPLADDNAARIPLNAYDVPVPDCTGHTYKASDVLGHTGLTGLYCIDGDFMMNNNKESFSGTNMTLVFLGGKVSLNGGTASISAPKVAGYKGQALAGIAIYMPTQYYGSSCGEVNQELKINGNSSNKFVGTILAPCSDISIEGAGDSWSYNSQIIGYNVNSGGNASVHVGWCGCEQGTRYPTIDLLR